MKIPIYISVTLLLIFCLFFSGSFPVLSEENNTNLNEQLEQDEGIQEISHTKVYLIHILHKGYRPQIDKQKSEYFFSFECHPPNFPSDPCSIEESLHYFYRKKQRNNLMVVNSIARAAVRIVEWYPEIQLLCLEMDNSKKLFLADSEGIITVLDSEKNYAEIKKLSTQPYNIYDMVVNKSGDRIYCTLENNGYVAVGILGVKEYFYKYIYLANPLENTLIRDIAVDENNQYAYVTLSSETDGKVAIINIDTYQFEGTVEVGENPYGLEISPDGDKLYVANEESGNVSVIETSTQKVIKTIEVGQKPSKIAITPDGKKVYVTNRESNSVSVIDSETQTVLTTIPAGTEPLAVTISEDGEMLFVANYGSDDVTMINIENDSVVNTTISFPGGVPVDLEVK